MSLKAVEAFDKRIKDNYKFFYRLEETLKGLSSEERTQKIVEFAKQQGFNFSKQDFKRFEELSKRSETELEEVELPENPLKKFFTRLSNLFQNTLFYLGWFGKRKPIAPKPPEPGKENSPSPIPNEPKLSVNWLERFFIWLSGASPKILATCPDSEQRKHAALGGTVLIPMLFSIITASFLLYTLNFNTSAITFAATIWATIILIMDRALIATYRKKYSRWQIFLRLIISFIIAMTIAHPTVLLLFSGTIDSVYDEEVRKPQRDKLSSEKCNLQKSKSEIAVQKSEIESKEKELKEAQNPPNCEEQDSFENSESGKNLIVDIDKYKLIAANAENGQCAQSSGEIKTCKKGCGPVCQTANKRVKELRETLDREKQRFNNNLSARKSNCVKRASSLGERLPKLNEELDAFGNKLKQLEEQCKQEEEKINNLKPDILSQSSILHEIIFGEKGNLLASFTFFIFVSLFLLIDMLAIFLKVVSTGTYDLKVDTVESNNELISFIEYRRQHMAKFTNSESKERAIINVMKNNSLKRTLEEALNSQVDSFCEDDRQKREAFFRSRLTTKNQSSK